MLVRNSCLQFLLLMLRQRSWFPAWSGWKHLIAQPSPKSLLGDFGEAVLAHRLQEEGLLTSLLEGRLSMGTYGFNDLQTPWSPL